MEVKSLMVSVTLYSDFANRRHSRRLNTRMVATLFEILIDIISYKILLYQYYINSNNKYFCSFAKSTLLLIKLLDE